MTETTHQISQDTAESMVTLESEVHSDNLCMTTIINANVQGTRDEETAKVSNSTPAQLLETFAWGQEIHSGLEEHHTDDAMEVDCAKVDDKQTAGHQHVVPELLMAFSMEFGNNKDKLTSTELTVKDANSDSGSSKHIKHKLTDRMIDETNWDSCENFMIKVDKASMAQTQCEVKHDASEGSKQVADVADVATSHPFEVSVIPFVFHVPLTLTLSTSSNLNPS